MANCKDKNYNDFEDSNLLCTNNIYHNNGIYNNLDECSNSNPAQPDAEPEPEPGANTRRFLESETFYYIENGKNCKSTITKDDPDFREKCPFFLTLIMNVLIDIH